MKEEDFMKDGPVIVHPDYGSEASLYTILVYYYKQHACPEPEKIAKEYISAVIK